MNDASLPAVRIGAGADRPPEEREIARDHVRLLLSDLLGETHARFDHLAGILRSGDLLVVNESETLPASLPASGEPGEFVVNLSTPYGPNLWVAEPRWDAAHPGPLPVGAGDLVRVGGVRCTIVSEFPGIPRLVFLRSEEDLREVMRSQGQPIRYGYAARAFPLSAYQTAFARVPGSAEMPSAGRPFTGRLLDRLARGGVRVAPVVLHAGVSSLEVGDSGPGSVPVFPEPFEVPAATANTIGDTRASGGRVIAVGTTVVRALESAVDSCGEIREARGFTRLYLNPGRPIRSVDGLLTGFHDARSTHLALLASFFGSERVERAYEVAARTGYLWHEFGDSHLILRGSAGPADERDSPAS